jgi:hypothetical protein
MCFGVDPDTLQGTCVAMCQGTWNNPECPADTECMIANNGVLDLCLPTCDPLADDCAADQTCRPHAYGEGTFFCVPVGTAGYIDDGCRNVGGCDLGQLCIPADMHPDCTEPGGCCSNWCDLADPVTADAQCAMQLFGSVCVPYLVEGETLPGHPTLGHCADA